MFLASAGTAACSSADIDSEANPDIGTTSDEARLEEAAAPTATALDKVIPAPVSVQSTAGQTHTLTQNTVIYTEAGSPEAARAGEYLATLLRPATGYPLPVRPATAQSAGIVLLLGGADPKVGPAGYELDVNANRIAIRANAGAGLFAAVQTLRQLLPVTIESSVKEAGPWQVAGGHIVDYPKFAFRGAMLDVARHFFTVDKVKKYIDHLVRYKLNYLHLHLSDDQGWRIQIDAYPKLATHGGSTQVGGGPGGYYTKADYAELVAYAAARYITVIPEIDMPGHTNAALASVAELNCDNKPRPLYTGTDVGFSSFCMDAQHRDFVTRFVGDVVRELSAMTPGPYIHLGGDEAQSTSEADYKAFEERIMPILAQYDKKLIGWHEILKAAPPTSALAQYWGTTPTDSSVQAAASRGLKILLSPANKTYLDMKYNKNTPLGQDWAGLIEVRDAYSINPANYLTGVSSEHVAGLEAPLWTETITTVANIEYMIFPRLPALAERGWSTSNHTWDEFKKRLAAQGPRWTKANITYYASPQVPWP